MRFGRKKKSKTPAVHEAEKEVTREKKKKAGKGNRRTPAVVSTPVHSLRARTRVGLRRRVSQLSPAKSEFKYVIDVGQNRIVGASRGLGQQYGDGLDREEEGWPPTATTNSQGDEDATRLDATPCSKRELKKMTANSGNNKQVLRQPSNPPRITATRNPTDRKSCPPVPPPPPPPPPPLWTKKPHPVRRVPKEPCPRPAQRSLAKARSLEDLLTAPTSTTPRSRKASDLCKWVRWRTDVNQKLSGFMMDSTGSKSMAPLPGNFSRPKSMKKETLNAILFHAYSDNTQLTSLDTLSYMIYGIPRAETKHRSRSMEELSRDDKPPKTEPKPPLPRCSSPVPDGCIYADTIEKVPHSTPYGYMERILHKAKSSAPPLPPSPEMRLLATNQPSELYLSSIELNETDVYGYSQSIAPALAVPRARTDSSRAHGGSTPQVPEPGWKASPKAHYQNRPVKPSFYIPKQDSPPLEFNGHVYKPPVAGGVPTILTGLALHGHLPTPPRSEVRAISTHARGGKSLSFAPPSPSSLPSQSKKLPGHLMDRSSHQVAFGSPRRH